MSEMVGRYPSLFRKQKTACEILACLEFRRVLFRSRIGRLGGAAAAGGGRDALSYGVSFATTRSHQLARGAPACFLSGISGWFSRSEERRVGKEGRSRWSPYH